MSHMEKTILLLKKSSKGFAVEGKIVISLCESTMKYECLHSETLIPFFFLMVCTSPRTSNSKLITSFIIDDAHFFNNNNNNNNNNIKTLAMNVN